ncbi:uncharacterized protein PAC_19941 [Phialocephala subalpina]|uniref:Uncharacterized protein n=1 Tax=Phialocephala subalpina TaxID=576137 RepID=A0A1L7XYF6_9HELO|nr:uncharacterized protein PAC_19941 [Phialocephala subalpina]
MNSSNNPTPQPPGTLGSGTTKKDPIMLIDSDCDETESNKQMAENEANAEEEQEKKIKLKGLVSRRPAHLQGFPCDADTLWAPGERTLGPTWEPQFQRLLKLDDETEVEKALGGRLCVKLESWYRILGDGRWLNDDIIEPKPLAQIPSGTPPLATMLCT